MRSPAKSDVFLPLALLALSAIPVAAGVVRLAKLAAGNSGAAADARFFAAPAPVVLHVFTVTAFCALGALQFAPGFRRRHRGWHRAAGRLLIPCGLAAALTGLWMTQFYPNAVNGGDLLHGTRLVVGAGMVACLVAAVSAIRRRDFTAHGQWMIRAYALGQGAGTQALTGLPWALLVGVPGVTTNALLMGGSWILNIILAEWIIRRWLPGPGRRRSGVAADADLRPAQGEGR